MDFHQKTNEIENTIEKQCFLNFHLSFNAQTQMSHTEPDGSYTVIIVPNRMENSESITNHN